MQRQELIDSLYAEGLNQQEVATRLGVSQPTISRWLRRLSGVITPGNIARSGLTEEEKRIDNALWSRYRIRLKEARLIWRNQGNKCACCGIPGPVTFMSGTEWPIDHNHDCCVVYPTCGSCIRGVVCRPCNNSVTNHMSRETWESIGEYLGYQ